MKTITLARQVSYTFQTYATYGIFYDGQSPFAVSLEPPKGHRIAPGCFIVEPYFSPSRRKWVFQLCDVPGHSNIQVHTGVFPRDTKGCIIIGESFEYLTYKGFTGDGLDYSSKAYFELMARVGGKTNFMLNIIEC